MIQSVFNNKFFRFALVGGGATALQYILLIVFIEFTSIPEISASALGFGLSALFNYWLNYHFTFASDKQHRDTLPKFAITATLGLGVNTLSFAILLSLLPHYLMAQLGATGITLVINFLLHKYWIYRS